MEYKYYAFLTLKNRLNKLSGFAFQEFLGNILKEKYGDDFIMPWKCGSYGDYKNDGLVKSQGIYFAMYGPEKSDINLEYTRNKIKTDLEGLLKAIKNEKWCTKLNKFIFVINNKLNNNMPAPIYSYASTLEKEYNINITIWSQKEIEQIFSDLSDLQIVRVLELPYFDNDDIHLDAEIIAEIIENIIALPYKVISVSEPLEFIEKIKFNNLNFTNYSLLNNAYLYVNKLEDILKEYKNFSDEELGKKMLTLYLESKEIFTDSNDQFNNIFINIYKCSDKFKENSKKQIDDAKMVIMAKYFENCTIFESKKSEE